MNILSYNPGHDGAIAYLRDARLRFRLRRRRTHITVTRLYPVMMSLTFLANSKKCPMFSVRAVGGHATTTSGPRTVPVPRRVEERHRLWPTAPFGKASRYFSSSHERSHFLCAFGMSSLTKGTPCYALVWEGGIGAFYEIDSELNITFLADVLNEPGNRYASLRLGRSNIS